MLEDQGVRRALVDWADRVDVDTDADLELVLEAGGARRHRRRVEVLVAACLVLLALVGGILAWRVAGRGASPDDAVISPSQLVGTYSRSVPRQESSQVDAVGPWTMTLDADGTVGLAAPSWWVALRGGPSGVSFTADGGRLRINAFASELCSGSVGEYAVAVAPTALVLRPVVEPCGAREEVLAGRWERAP